MNELVSIIIPAYNVAAFLERCVRSVISQTYQSIEIIIVDDGSKDDTLNAAKAMVALDNRIVVLHQENQGVTMARLNGVKAAKGAWIGFVDGDDCVEQDMFERLLKLALDHSAEISHCGYQLITPNQTEYYYNTGRTVLQDSITGLRDLLTGLFVEPGLCNKLYKRELFYPLIEENKMDITIRNTEDLLMNYYLFKEAKLSVYEDWCPYHYIVREGSAVQSKPTAKKLTDPLSVLKTIYEKEADDKMLRGVLLDRIANRLISLATRKKDSDKQINEVCMEARKELKNMAAEIIGCNTVKKKTKAMVLWTTVWPWSYGFVHWIYAYIRGRR